MFRYQLALNGKDGTRYFDWSTVREGPVTYGMNLQQFQQYYLEEYGRHDFAAFPEVMRMLQAYGTSSRSAFDSVEKLISGNMAGPDDGELTAEEIYLAYGLREPIRDGWLARIDISHEARVAAVKSEVAAMLRELNGEEDAANELRTTIGLFEEATACLFRVQERNPADLRLLRVLNMLGYMTDLVRDLEGGATGAGQWENFAKGIRDQLAMLFTENHGRDMVVLVMPGRNVERY